MASALCEGPGDGRDAGSQASPWIMQDSASHASQLRIEFSEGTGSKGGKGTTMSFARTLSSVVAAAISTAACGGDSVHAAAITFRCTNPKSGTTWEVKVDYDRGTAELVSGRDHREPNRLARHIARRLLLPGSCLRRADVPECLEHGRLCYPPYMPCRLIKFWARLPKIQAMRNGKRFRSYPLLQRKSRWFAMLARPAR